jgi:hypothetical protein
MIGCRIAGTCPQKDQSGRQQQDKGESCRDIFWAVCGYCCCPLIKN